MGVENLMRAQILQFLFFLMWILMLVGGGLMVVVIGPFSLGGFGGIDPIIFSGIKVGIALVFDIHLGFSYWQKIKNWIFRSQIKS